MIEKDITTIKALDNFFKKHSLGFTIQDNDDIDEFISYMADSSDSTVLTFPEKNGTMIQSTEQFFDFIGGIIEEEISE